MTIARAKDFHLKNWVLRLVAIDISLVHLDNRKNRCVMVVGRGYRKRKKPGRESESKTCC